MCHKRNNFKGFTVSSILMMIKWLKLCTYRVSPFYNDRFPIIYGMKKWTMKQTFLALIIDSCIKQKITIGLFFQYVFLNMVIDLLPDVRIFLFMQNSLKKKNTIKLNRNNRKWLYLSIYQSQIKLYVKKLFLQLIVRKHKCL